MPLHQQEEKGLKKCGKNLGNWSKGAHGCNEEGGMQGNVPSAAFLVTGYLKFETEQ